MKTINPVYKKRLFGIINSSAFPTHMKMKIVDIAIGSCRFEMAAAEFRIQPFGAIHGGNVATAIDSATFWACYFSMEDDNDGITSIDLKFNYLNPCFGGAITCDGKLIKAGKTLFYAEATALDEKGTVLAHGTSALMRLPGRGLKLETPMLQ